MRILLVEPFFTGSHKQWAEGYQKHSQHEIELLTLPGKFWKWRMAAGAVALASQFLKSDFEPDLILATDMLDLATFLSLSRKKSFGIPTAIYFHENQITYPWSPTDEDVSLKRDHHYGFMNYTSALTADKVFFNSQYHYDSFLNTLPDFLRKFPDFKGLENVEKIKIKSCVLSLGMDLKRLQMKNSTEPNSSQSSPVLLWNHRWEYDKDPDTFFKTLFKLEKEKINFRLIVLGESFQKTPPIFAEAKGKLQSKILHWGYAETFENYKNWINQADILPVTSRQDFFGGSVVEAIYCGCIPLLPNRLAFPEHIPLAYHSQFLYESERDFYDKLKRMILNLNQTITVRNFVAGYDWTTFVAYYDEAVLNFNKNS